MPDRWIHYHEYCHQNYQYYYHYYYHILPLQVPDWAAGHYYALDGSVASYDSECAHDPYKELALLEA